MLPNFASSTDSCSYKFRMRCFSTGAMRTVSCKSFQTLESVDGRRTFPATECNLALSLCRIEVGPSNVQMRRLTYRK